MGLWSTADLESPGQRPQRGMRDATKWSSVAQLRLSALLPCTSLQVRARSLTSVVPGCNRGIRGTIAQDSDEPLIKSPQRGGEAQCQRVLLLPHPGAVKCVSGIGTVSNNAGSCFASA